MIESVFYICFIILIFIVISIKSGRKPYTSAKITFGIFGFFFILWNFLHFLSQFIEVSPIFLEIFPVIVFSSLVLFSINFPFYMRTRTSFIAIAAALFGATFAVIAISLHQQGEDVHPNNIYLDLIQVVLLIAFIGMFYMKIKITSPRLLKFFYNTFLAILVFNSIFYFVNNRFMQVNQLLQYADLTFLVSVFSFKIHFPPMDHSPSIISIFYQGNKPKMIFEETIPVGLTGIRNVKTKLWKLFEIENLNRYIDKFWYNILIDETLDNAAQHGGKRQQDDITIQIYEGKKYVDFYIIDRGKGFDPHKIPSPLEESRKSIPSGRGIHLMKNTFDIRWNFIGNEVRVRINKLTASAPYSPGVWV